MISLIAAYAYDRDGRPVIGNNNRLPWHLPEDLEWFRNHTLFKTLVMGRKTYETIPGGHLKNRRIAVLTDNLEYKLSVSKEQAFLADATDLIQKFVGENNLSHLVVCGGSSVYKVFLPFVSSVLLTEIHAKYDGDTFLPFTVDELKRSHNFSMVMIDRNQRRFRNEPSDLDWTHMLFTRNSRQ